MFDTVAPYLTFWGTGALITLVLSVAAFPVAIALGIAAALAASTGRGPRARTALSYMALFRALPEVLVIFAIFYGSTILLRRVEAWTGVFLPDVSPVLAALVALSVQFGAYAAVIFSDWLRVFPRGLLEAGAAVGMTNSQVRLRILVPLLLRQSTPALGNLMLVLLKVSALVSLIGVEELSRRTTIVAGSTRDPLLCYAIAAAMYLAITAVTSTAQAWIETRIRATG